MRSAALIPPSGAPGSLVGTEDALQKRLAEFRRAEFAGLTQRPLPVRTRPADEGECNPLFVRLTLPPVIGAAVPQDSHEGTQHAPSGA